MSCRKHFTGHKRICNICSISISRDKPKKETDELKTSDVRTFAPTAAKKQKTMFLAMGMQGRTAFSSVTKKTFMTKKKLNNSKFSVKTSKPLPSLLVCKEKY